MTATFPTYPPIQPPRKNHTKLALAIVIGLAMLALSVLVIVGVSSSTHSPTSPTSSVDQSSYDMGYQNGSTGHAWDMVAQQGFGFNDACQEAETDLHMYEDNPGLRGIYGPIPSNTSDWMQGCLAGAAAEWKLTHIPAPAE